VTADGYALPIGLESALVQDYFTTTTVTTTSATTTSATTTSRTTVTTTTSSATSTVTNTTNTTTTTRTTTTSTAEPAAVIRGSMELDLGTANVTEFAADPEVKDAVARSLAQHLGVPAEYLEVILTVVPERRLDPVSDGARRLSGGKVRVDYIIRLPVDAPATVSDAATITSQLQAATASSEMTELISSSVDEVAGAGRYTVTVAAMSVPTVEIFQAETSTTTATAAPSTSQAEEGGSGAGVAVGATLGTLSAVGLGAGVGYYLWRRNQPDSDAVQPYKVQDDALRGAGEADDDDCPYELSIFEELARKPAPLQ